MWAEQRVNKPRGGPGYLYMVVSTFAGLELVLSSESDSGLLVKDILIV